MKRSFLAVGALALVAAMLIAGCGGGSSSSSTTSTEAASAETEAKEEKPAVEETARWVTEVPKAHVEPFVPRISLTLTALNSCHEMLFEASGAGKRAILTRVFDGENLPANRAHAQGETIWLLDREALPDNVRE